MECPNNIVTHISKPTCKVETSHTCKKYMVATIYPHVYYYGYWVPAMHSWGALLEGLGSWTPLKPCGGVLFLERQVHIYMHTHRTNTAWLMTKMGNWLTKYNPLWWALKKTDVGRCMNRMNGVQGYCQYWFWAAKHVFLVLSIFFGVAATLPFDLSWKIGFGSLVKLSFELLFRLLQSCFWSWLWDAAKLTLSLFLGKNTFELGFGLPQSCQLSFETGFQSLQRYYLRLIFGF